jgi:hypothetical protein
MPLQITSATNYSINDGIITANYSEEIFTSQLEANHFVNPNPGGINNGRGRSKIGKKSSFLVNLLITLAVAFALLTAYYYVTSITALASFGLGGTTILAAAAEAYGAIAAGAESAYLWLAGPSEFLQTTLGYTGPVGWAILAVIAVLYVAGVDVGSELANAEDSVKDALADVNDWIDSW